MGVGRSRKSMGNVTYRTLRGRTIGSQKRTATATGATTRGMTGNFRKPLFAMINMYMASHASDIEVSFNKSKYGSQRNYFFTKNYKGMQNALMTLAQSSSVNNVLPELSEVEAAVTSYATANPQSILRVDLAGFERKYLSDAWSSDDNPISGGAIDGLGTGEATTTADAATYTAPIAVSMNFHSGAKIVRDAGTVEIKAAAIGSAPAAADIQYLTAGQAVVDIAVTNVSYKNGVLQYDAAAIAEAQHVVGLRVGNVFVRLTSAYVRTSNQVENPLG